MSVTRKYIQRVKQNGISTGGACQRYVVDYDTASTLITGALAVQDWQSTQANLATWQLSTDSTLLASINEQVSPYRRDYFLDFVDAYPDNNFRTS